MSEVKDNQQSIHIDSASLTESISQNNPSSYTSQASEVNAPAYANSTQAQALSDSVASKQDVHISQRSPVLTLGERYKQEQAEVAQKQQHTENSVDSQNTTNQSITPDRAIAAGCATVNTTDKSASFSTGELKEAQNMSRCGCSNTNSNVDNATSLQRASLGFDNQASALSIQAENTLNVQAQKEADLLKEQTNKLSQEPLNEQCNEKVQDQQLQASQYQTSSLQTISQQSASLELAKEDSSNSSCNGSNDSSTGTISIASEGGAAETLGENESIGAAQSQCSVEDFNASQIATQSQVGSSANEAAVFSPASDALSDSTTGSTNTESTSDTLSLMDGSGTSTDNEEFNIVLHGNAASRGIAFGRIAFLHRDAPASARYDVEDAEAEVERFEAARNEAILQLSNLYEATVEKLGEQNAVVFQIHQMMLDDPEYVDAIRNTIRDEKVNAEYAVQTTGERFADLFRAMEDNEYMQGRAADVIDVSRRLTDLLNNQGRGFATKTVYHNTDNTEPIILATDDLAPSETVQLDQNLVHAILTTEGSSRSHTVIFARTLGLPAVINIGQRLIPSFEGKLAIVDGGSGIVIINPDDKTRMQYIERKRTEDALRARLEQFRGKETRTLSGRKINLYANIGAVSDIDLVKTSDAEGIGLFRSEYIYLSSNDFPTEETQFNIYKETLEGMDGKKVVIRTLDIGADKTADYFMLKHEENPAMGMRAVRICLTRPEIFKTQLRALYRASVYGTLAIMFPMITSVEEIQECKKLCKEVQAELKAEGKPFSDNVELGIMIETPASAVISDLLAEHVDFFSIGTNDLIQFTLAVDRQNAEVGRFLNPYHRAVIRLIEMTVNNAHKNGIWVGVCGELAADEGFTHELIRIGVDELSVVPSSILMLRARISTLG